MNTTDTVKDIIQSRVDLVKDMQFRLELVHPGTKQRMTPAQREEFLLTAFSEIAKGTGVAAGADGRWRQVPADCSPLA